MDQTETPAVILKLRQARTYGLKSLENLGKKPLMMQFLHQVLFAFKPLYGNEAPIVQKYWSALKSMNNLSQDDYLALFQQFDYHLNLIESLSGQGTGSSQSCPSLAPPGRSIFIIHGSDEINILRLRAMLQDHFRLETVLMTRQPGMSRALLDKYENAASRCSMAFALMTRDDEISNHGTPYFQARPNVIFEAGWFVGRLGIPRVCLLLQEGTKVHSDIDGISRIHFRENVEEKVIDIQRELEAIDVV